MSRRATSAARTRRRRGPQTHHNTCTLVFEDGELVVLEMRPRLPYYWSAEYAATALRDNYAIRVTNDADMIQRVRELLEDEDQ